MNRTTVAVLAAALLLATGCGSSHQDPDPAACREAIRAQYLPGTATLKGEPGTPKECDGLSADEVSKIAVSVIEENTQ
jgi:hypothetical protein